MHLLLLKFALGGILHVGISLSVLLGLKFGASPSGGFLIGLADGVALGLGLLLVALDDRAGDEADVVHLGNVDRLGGVFTIFVQPILN